MKLLAYITSCLSFSSVSEALIPAQLAPISHLDSAGFFHVTLPTFVGRTYFIKMSLDLETWTYSAAPSDIIAGDGGALIVSIDTATSGSAWLAFEYSDYQTSDIQNADFNFDGLTNIQNLQLNTSAVVETPGVGLPPLTDPEVAENFPFVLRRVVLSPNANPPREKTDFNLDAGFNLEGGGFWPGHYESEDPGVTTTFQLFGDPGDSDAVLNLVNHKSRPGLSGIVHTGFPENLTIRQNDAIDLQRSNILVFESEGGTAHTGGILPVDISVSFGIAPPAPRGTNTAREELELYLSGVAGGLRANNMWSIPRRDSKGNIISFLGVEITETETPLVRALQGQGRAVVYDGHSNFGIGPNFTQTTHKVLADFTSFGSGYTDIPVGVLPNALNTPADNLRIDAFNDFRGNGAEVSVDQHLEAITNAWNGIPGATIPQLGDLEQDAALSRLFVEGWAYLALNVAAPTQVPTTRNNYNSFFIGGTHAAPGFGGLRFPNDQGVTHGNPFPLIQGLGIEQRHYTASDFNSVEEHLIINVSREDVPGIFGYVTYFYNACSTGRDYIEEFNHGDFIYTTEACAVRIATRDFVRLTIEGETNAEIVEWMNNEDLGDTGNDTYDYRSF